MYQKRRSALIVVPMHNRAELTPTNRFPFNIWRIILVRMTSISLSRNRSNTFAWMRLEAVWVWVFRRVLSQVPDYCCRKTSIGVLRSITIFSSIISDALALSDQLAAWCGLDLDYSVRPGFGAPIVPSERFACWETRTFASKDWASRMSSAQRILIDPDAVLREVRSVHFIRLLEFPRRLDQENASFLIMHGWDGTVAPFDLTRTSNEDHFGLIVL